MNRNVLNTQSMKAWKEVHTLEDVFNWHKQYTPFWDDVFIKKHLLPMYEKLDMENPQKENQFNEFERLYINSR